MLISRTAEAAAKAASAATYGGGTVAFFGGLSANETAALGGLLVGIVGLIANIWFKAQHLKIARAGLARANLKSLVEAED